MLKNPLYIYGSKDLHIPAHLNFADYMLDNIVKYGDRKAFVSVYLLNNYNTKYIYLHIVTVSFDYFLGKQIFSLTLNCSSPMCDVVLII